MAENDTFRAGRSKRANLNRTVGRFLTQNQAGRGPGRAAGSDNSTVQLVQNLLGTKDISSFLKQRDEAKAGVTRAAQGREDFLNQLRNQGQLGTAEERLAQTRASILKEGDNPEGTKLVIQGLGKFIDRSTPPSKSEFRKRVEAADTVQGITKSLGKSEVEKNLAEAKNFEAATRKLFPRPGAGNAGLQNPASSGSGGGFKASDFSAVPVPGKGSSFNNLNTAVGNGVKTFTGAQEKLNQVQREFNNPLAGRSTSGLSSTPKRKVNKSIPQRIDDLIGRGIKGAKAAPGAFLEDIKKSFR